MKINKEILNVLRGMKFLVSNYTLDKEEEYPNSPFRNMLQIKMKDFKSVKCAFCEELNFGFCWNCEKPHCKKDGYGIFTPPFMNTFCIECTEELIKLAKKEGAFKN